MNQFMHICPLHECLAGFLFIYVLLHTFVLVELNKDFEVFKF